MAVLNDLIVTNSAKILSTVYGAGFSIDGSVQIRPGWSNELNILSSSSNLYINYRDSSVSKFIFWNGGGSSGSGGIVEAAAYNATSDRRLKNNLREFKLNTDSSEDSKSILDLPIYKFDFINGQKDQIGCMAQDLQKICPEIVEESTDGYLAIKESKIVYLLIEEVKQLKNQLQIVTKNFEEYKNLHP